jgi:hypothetical protein
MSKPAGHGVLPENSAARPKFMVALCNMALRASADNKAFIAPFMEIERDCHRNLALHHHK